MKNVKHLLLLFAVLMTTGAAYAQVRPDITTFNATQQATLVAAMQQFIDADVLEEHCNFDPLNLNLIDIHSDFDFLPFHRTYIENMEDFLILQGLSQFVPLPGWDPNTPTPALFRVVDPDCGSATCNNGNGTCNTPSNWTPSVALFNYLSLPVQPGANNDICDHPFSPTVPNGSNSNGLSRKLELPYHNSVHQNMSGVMGNFRSPAAPIFWLWHAYMDDLWKSWECTCPASTTQPVDLYIKDTDQRIESDRDRGEEPNIDTGPMWISEDIWIRNQADGLTTDVHQNPEYNNGAAVYVYVRVRNRGCVPSTGNEQLNLHWSKAATALAWPSHWDGSMTNPIIMGDLVNTQSIGVIPAGGSTIVQFSWVPPNPNDYSFNTQPHHFCLLARVIASNDPMAVTEGSSVYSNAKQNNNIAWKNISVIYIAGIAGGGNNGEYGPGANIFVGNAWEEDMLFNLDFEAPVNELGIPITEITEVILTMDEMVWERWLGAGAEGENVEIVNEDLRQVRVYGEQAMIKGLHFEPLERGEVHLGFNLPEPLQLEQNEFEFHVNQKETYTGDLVGGELYKITINDEPPRFRADAGPDTRIGVSEKYTLHAMDIGEAATYNWYDTNGNLVHTGKSLEVDAESAQRFKLEVIARKDQHKDYDLVTINVKEAEIISISPNPADNQVEVKFSAPKAQKAYLMVVQPYGTRSENYLIDASQGQAEIDISRFMPGTYNVILVTDGKAVDLKPLVIH